MSDKDKKEPPQKKQRFQYGNHTPVEWCEEWIKNGKVMRSRTTNPQLCMLASYMQTSDYQCPKKIKAGDEYYVAGSWQSIAHKKCADRMWNQHLAQKIGEDSSAMQKQKDAEWKAQEKLRMQKGVIPMPTELPPAPPPQEQRSAQVFHLPVAASLPMDNELQLQIELARVRAEYQGFVKAAEMFLSVQQRQQRPIIDLNPSPAKVEE